MAKTNAAKAKTVLDDLSIENDILKAEVQRLTDLREEDQASLAQKIDDAKETATDKTLYRVWSTNLGVLNLSFLMENWSLPWLGGRSGSSRRSRILSLRQPMVAMRVKRLSQLT